MCLLVHESCCFKPSGYWDGKERRKMLVVKEWLEGMGMCVVGEGGENILLLLR